MTIWHKKNNYPPGCICMTHVWSSTLFPRSIIIFQGVLTKCNFLTKFPHLEKFANLMKDLKYEHQSIFSLWGRVKLNFRDRYGKLFFLRTPAAIKFFHQILKNCHWCKKKSFQPRWICITYIWNPTLFPRGIIIFQGVLTKFNFLKEIPTSGKICRFNEGLRI